MSPAALNVSEERDMGIGKQSEDFYMKIELKIPTMEDTEGLKAVCNAVDRQYLSDRLPYPYTDESAE